MRVGALNVSPMTGKGRDLADIRGKVDVLCVQETRWKGGKARSTGAGFKLYCHSELRKNRGLGGIHEERFKGETSVVQGHECVEGN